MCSTVSLSNSLRANATVPSAWMFETMRNKLNSSGVLRIKTAEVFRQVLFHTEMLLISFVLKHAMRPAVILAPGKGSSPPFRRGGLHPLSRRRGSAPNRTHPSTRTLENNLLLPTSTQVLHDRPMQSAWQQSDQSLWHLWQSSGRPRIPTSNGISLTSGENSMA